VNAVGKVTCMVGAAVTITGLIAAFATGSATFFIPVLLGVAAMWSAVAAQEPQP